MRHVVLLRKARADVDQIWTWIAKDNIPAADRIKALIDDAMLRLAEIPDQGHRRQDVRDQSFRFWVVRPYVIAYKFDDTQLTVYRVLHGARDFTKHF